MSDELNKTSEPAAAEAPASSEAAQDAAPENATEVANTEATDAEQPSANPDVESETKPEETEAESAKQDAPDTSAPESGDGVPIREKAEDTEQTPAAAEEKKPRRKSTGVPEHKGRKLNKKQSKAELTHPDAKPGDYFFVKMKGYPLWPGIVASEDMLPKTILDSRSVLAQRADGTWREDLEEGGKNYTQRVFPLMFLHTNEFSWTRNTDLVTLDLDTVGETNPKMRKDLIAAHELAAEKHDLEYFKGVLRDFQEALTQATAERDAKRQEKEAAAKKKADKAKRKSTASEAAAASDEAAEDVEMEDADDSGELDPEEPKKASKKRKAEDGANTPARTDSVKKPKIKINNTPKATNGDTPKASAKKEPKPKVSKPKKETNGKAASSKEPELSAEEKRAKKEKEILFLRHKLQKGLLTKEQAPKDEEMKQMSEYIVKLEGYAELEVSIIRATKINKVLKAILKLDEIPKEDEFKFKDRSRALLEQWTKILDGEGAASAGTPAATADDKKESSSGTTKTEEEETKEQEIKESDTTEAEVKEPETKSASEEEKKESAAAAEDTTMTDAPAQDSSVPETTAENEAAQAEPATETAA